MSMQEIERTTVTIKDLEAIADVLEATLTFVQAKSLMEAQLSMRPPTPTTFEIETSRVLARVQGLIKDYYYENRHDLGEQTETPGEVEQEKLPDMPLGKVEIKRAQEPWDFPGNGSTMQERDRLFREGSGANE